MLNLRMDSRCPTSGNLSVVRYCPAPHSVEGRVAFPAERWCDGDWRACGGASRGYEEAFVKSEELLNVPDAAQYLGIRPWTLRN